MVVSCAAVLLCRLAEMQTSLEQLDAMEGFERSDDDMNSTVVLLEQLEFNESMSHQDVIAFFVGFSETG